jgi:hypothetical protein
MMAFMYQKKFQPEGKRHLTEFGMNAGARKILLI